MATQRTSFNKLQRDRDKQEKAAAKRDRRQNRAAGTEEEPIEGAPVIGNVRSAQELLDEVEKVHRQFDDGMIDFETYEDKKTLLLSQLPVD
jgi:hypothetical protein